MTGSTDELSKALISVATMPAAAQMVASNYDATRSALAKQIGLGRKASTKMDEPEVAQPEELKTTIGLARRARGSKG